LSFLVFGGAPPQYKYTFEVSSDPLNEILAAVFGVNFSNRIFSKIGAFWRFLTVWVPSEFAWMWYGRIASRKVEWLISFLCCLLFGCSLQLFCGYSFAAITMNLFISPTNWEI
jgi:hypothetical protein